MQCSETGKAFEDTNAVFAVVDSAGRTIAMVSKEVVLAIPSDRREWEDRCTEGSSGANIHRTVYDAGHFHVDDFVFSITRRVLERHLPNVASIS